MQLRLRYHDHPVRPAAAAFIRGKDAGIWLKEMSSWGIPLSGLTCLIVAESTASVTPAGLFIIFQEGKAPDAGMNSQLYGVLADKLYLPVNATLYPDADPDELKSMLPWEWHIFHPSLGFTGFEKSDRLDLSTLLDYTPEFERQWTFARPGVPPPAQLQYITLEKTQSDDVLKYLEEGISKKSLKDINKDEETSGAKKLLEDAKSAAVRGLLKGLNSLLNGNPSRKTSSRPVSGGSFSGSFGSGGGTGGGFSSFSFSPGLLAQFRSWLSKKVLDLEKERNKELNRLLQMFDEDIQKALEYAIPLGGMFADRGVAPPSAHLGRRSTDLDFSRLGGGLRGDSWDVNEHFEKSLRQKYQEAANNAIANKDFKRAAYVYAHLLGQYQEAANVLEQGRHYREAAAIYQKFLGNKLGAAQCLEKGGLLQEAIPLYLELEQHEKAGDLLMLTGKKDDATACYRKVIAQALTNKNRPEAARVLDEKLQLQDEAMDILLEGWDQDGQAEECLAHYYRLAAARDMDFLLRQVRHIHEAHTPAHRGMQFLNTLSAARRSFRDERLDTLSTGLSYEIISEQAAQGNTRSLEKLREFVPGDNLLNSDTQRFIHSRRKEQKSLPIPIPQPRSFSLNDAAPGLEKVFWTTCTTWKNQFLVIGTCDATKMLHLIRGNWKGEIEHWEWHFTHSHGIHINFLSSPAEGNKVYVVSNHPLPFQEHTLWANSKFEDEVKVVAPWWLSTIEPIGVYVHPDETFTIFQNNKSGSFPVTELARYSQEGKLESSKYCWEEEEDGPVTISSYRYAEVFYRNGNYYLADKSVPEEGYVKELVPDKEGIHVLAATSHNDALKLFACVYNDSETIGLMIRPNNQDRSLYNATPLPQKASIDEIRLISDRYLVVSKKDLAEVFDVKEEELVPLRSGITTEHRITAILPTDKRKQFALLDLEGNMTIHDVEED